MRSARTRNAFLVVMALLGTVLTARASGPASTYAVLEKVVFEPNEAAAERIQIWGAFAYVQGGIQNPSSTSDPQRGSMYFRIPANATAAQKDQIRKEWADLKAVAATGQAVAFGDWFYLGAFSPNMNNSQIYVRSGATGNVHVLKESDPKGTPVDYTTNSGIVKLPATGNHAAVVADLKALLKKWAEKQVTMKSLKTKIVLVVTVVLLLPAMVLMASDPVGIYCIVDKVVLEPSETSPLWIQIWGTFALWEGQPVTGSMQYSKPQRGYLYYRITADNDGRAERAEWADLKAIAGTGQGIAFGARYKPAGRIRPATEKPAEPDLYQIGAGISKVGYYQENMTTVIGEIKKAK